MPTCSRCHSRTPQQSCYVCGEPAHNELAYNEGLADFESGVDRAENPYSLRMAPECHDSWDKGWMNGDEEMNAAAL